MCANEQCGCSRPSLPKWTSGISPIRASWPAIPCSVDDWCWVKITPLLLARSQASRSRPSEAVPLPNTPMWPRTSPSEPLRHSSRPSSSAQRWAVPGERRMLPSIGSSLMSHRNGSLSDARIPTRHGRVRHRVGVEGGARLHEAGDAAAQHLQAAELRARVLVRGAHQVVPGGVVLVVVLGGRHVGEHAPGGLVAVVPVRVDEPRVHRRALGVDGLSRPWYAAATSWSGPTMTISRPAMATAPSA